MTNPSSEPIALIGIGAIGQWLAERCPGPVHLVRRGEPVPPLPLVVEAAGHGAVVEHGETALRQGSDLLLASVGALADEALHDRLFAAAKAEGAGRLLLPSGALGAIDALAAAREGGLSRVRYTARKPAATIAADREITSETILLEGSAREAALAFPKSANVAATVALAGLGFESTEVRVIADPSVTANIHIVEAEGAFGTFSFRIEGRPLPGNPRSSSLTAMSLLRAVRNRHARIVI